MVQKEILDLCLERYYDRMIEGIQNNMRIPSVKGKPEAGAPYGKFVNMALEDALLQPFPLGAPIAVNVTIGLFTIVKLFRTVNIMVNSLGRCIPERCTANATNSDPCNGFEDIRFPLDLFSPTAKPRSCCGFGTVFGDDCDTRRSREDCDA